MNNKYRIKKRKQFAYMYRVGRADHTKYLSLITTPTKLNQLKVGVSVSKKVGKAVKRNLVKRRILAIFKDMMPKVDSKHNYIIIAKAGCAELPFSDLVEQMNQLFARSGLIHD